MTMSTAYKIQSTTGVITFPDGFELIPPYEHPRYSEYAQWVSEGNSPEVLTTDDLIALVDIEVSPAQFRSALVRLGVYSIVQTAVGAPEADQELKIWWEYATSFHRNNPKVLMVARSLGRGRDFLDELFSLAAAIL